MIYKIDIQHLLPINTIGSENNAVSYVIYHSEKQAFDQFRRLAQNLLHINRWKINAGKNPTEFCIYNKELNRSAEASTNDLVKIKMPAPDNTLGKGFDWVIVNKIEAIETTDTKVFLLEMKPHSCAESVKNSIAHFYTEDASNTFILAKKDKTVQFSIHGRNEVPNTKTPKFLNSIRNLFVASGGIFGGSKVQWKDFVAEFINN